MEFEVLKAGTSKDGSFWVMIGHLSGEVFKTAFLTTKDLKTAGGTVKILAEDLHLIEWSL